MRSVERSGEQDEIAPIEIVRVAAWSKFPWLRHGFSTRMGGVTEAYRQGEDDKRLDLNLGFTSHDSETNVLENRRRFLAALGVGSGESTPPKLVTLRQIHSTQILRVDGTQAGGPRSVVRRWLDDERARCRFGNPDG